MSDLQWTPTQARGDQAVDDAIDADLREAGYDPEFCRQHSNGIGR